MNMSAQPAVLDYYRRQSRMSDPGPHAAAVAALPSDVAAIAKAAQGLILHEHWSGAYGQTLSDERRSEVHLRDLPAMLSQMLAHDGRPLDEPRALEDRLIGNCRDFTLFTVAALRAQGVPARGRCGFGSYFEAGKFVDHWVAEYWRSDEDRWVMVDAQIDDLQAGRIKPDFDLLDVPRSRFLTGGAAWRACRAGEADPDAFGIMHMHGLWFIAGDLVRDAAALAGMEMMAWDSWGAMPGPDGAVSDETLAWFDRVADLTRDPDASFEALMTLNRDDERLRVPPVVFNAVRGRPETV
jgi:hypothetical protein